MIKKLYISKDEILEYKDKGKMIYTDDGGDYVLHEETFTTEHFNKVVFDSQNHTFIIEEDKNPQKSKRKNRKSNEEIN